MISKWSEFCEAINSIGALHCLSRQLTEYDGSALEDICLSVLIKSFEKFSIDVDEWVENEASLDINRKITIDNFHIQEDLHKNDVKKEAVSEESKQDVKSKSLINDVQASEIYGKARNYFQSLRQRKKGPKFIRQGRMCMYDRKDLDAWFKSKEKKKSG